MPNKEYCGRRGLHIETCPVLDEEGMMKRKSNLADTGFRRSPMDQTYIKLLVSMAVDQTGKAGK